MTSPLRAVMLLSDAFGGFGGIAKFNRDFLSALSVSSHIESVHVLPRSIPEWIGTEIPKAIVYDRKAAAGILSYARRLARYLTSRDEVDIVICGHRNLLPAAWLLARLRSARLVLVIHGIEAWRRSPSPVVNWLSGQVDAVISVSRFSAERFLSWSRLPADSVFILPNCVDVERFKPQPKDPALIASNGLGASKLLMTVGRLAANERYKGFDEVIELMPHLLRRHPDLKYMIVGDGPDRPRLEALARAHSISDKVIFAGRISEDDKVDYYNLADVYVMPSSGEGFGIVLIEAAACGVPVVGSSIDGSREALLDGKLGRLVDPADVVGLYEAIAAALDKERSGGRIGEVETFSRERFVDRVAEWSEQICHSISGEPAPAARVRT